MDLQRMIERDYDVTFYTPPEPEPEMITPDAPQQDVSVGEFAQGMATTYADMAKGAAQGFVGMPGDIEGIARLLLDRMGFDVTQDTILPTTDEAKAFLDKFIPTFSETASGMDRSAAEYMGEMVAPGGYSKVAKPIVKGGKVVGKALAQEAANQVENILNKQGLILKFGPDAKVQIPAAPKVETPEFQNWFGASKVVDEGNKPLLMYHGTNKGGDEGLEFFDTYSGNHGLFGQGSYFTDNPDVASSYTKKGKGQNPAVYPVYLSIKNPIDMDAAADSEKWLNAFPDGQDYFPESGTNEQFYRGMEEFFMDEGYSAAEAPGAILETLMEMGYDGVTHIGGGRVAQDGVKHRVYIAFEPEQVKSVFNKGTFDPGDSRMLNSGVGVVATSAGSATMDKEQKAK